MRFLFKLLISFVFIVLLFVGQNMAAEIDSLSIEPVRNEAGVKSIHVFHLKFLDSVSSDAQWKVIYPSGFDLNSVKLAGSNSINGGFSVQVSGQTIIISRSGRGINLQPGVLYDMALANITNGPEGNYSISVQVLDVNGSADGVMKTVTVKILP